MSKKTKRKMNRQAKMKVMLKRDGHKCCIHSEGCEKTIDLSTQNEDLRATEDHILPKSYTRALGIVQNFEKPWNKQPSHKMCNNSRGGMIIDWPILKCECHGTYIEENGKRYFMHLEATGWKEEEYWSAGIEQQSNNQNIIKIEMQDNEKGEKIHEAILILANRHGILSAGLKGNKGHIINEIGIFRGIRHNAFELARTKQWAKLWEETKKFAGNYRKHGETNLKKELKNENSGETIAKIIFWHEKATKHIKTASISEEIEELIKKIDHNNEDGKTILEKIESYRKGEWIGEETRFIPLGHFEINPGDPAPEFARKCTEAAMMGRPDIALREVEKVIRRRSRESIGWTTRGRIKDIIGDYRGAIQDLTKSINIEPSSIAYAVRATSHANIGEWGKALADIRNAKIWIRKEHASGKKLVKAGSNQPVSFEQAMAEIEFFEHQIHRNAIKHQARNSQP